MMQLTIKRPRWLRGSPDDYSYLLHKTNGRMCCLGFLARECGMKAEDIRGRCAPYDTPSNPTAKKPWQRLLNKRKGDNTEVCYKLMSTNDSSKIADPVREAKLKVLFRRIGVQVRFVD